MQSAGKIDISIAKPVIGIGQRFFRRNPEDTSPLVISHERIYILPSRRGWAFISSLLIMLIASMNYSINLGFALCFILSGMLASSLLATYRNLAGLSLEFLRSYEAYAEETILFHLTFRNPHDRPRPGIRVSTIEKCSDIISLKPESQSNAEIEVPALQRGWQSLGRITLSTDYPLGLWYSWSYVHIPCKGLIYPAPELNPPPIPLGRLSDSGDNEKNRLHGEEEFYGLKNFQQGEPLSHIAWKAVARGQGMYSKEFTQERGRMKYHFSLEETRELSNIEDKLSRMTAWILKAHREGLDYSLELPGYQSCQGSGDAHRDALLKKIALFGIDDET